jgi:membrane-bound metal-dependent hydrolase YbcI (DUF457 family)
MAAATGTVSVLATVVASVLAAAAASVLAAAVGELIGVVPHACIDSTITTITMILIHFLMFILPPSMMEMIFPFLRNCASVLFILKMIPPLVTLKIYISKTVGRDCGQIETGIIPSTNQSSYL